MKPSSPELPDPAAWVTKAGIAGKQEIDLLAGFCQRVVAAGLPLRGAQILIDTLHPVHEGRVFRWRPDCAVEVFEYGRSTDEALALRWRRSPFYHLEQTETFSLRRTIGDQEVEEFPILAELRAQGQTDYLACVHRFSADTMFGDMDCIYSSWTTDAPDGFTEEQVDGLLEALPSLVLALKCASLVRVAATLVETYLGRDAGRRVLKGIISRGIAERINAVLWFSDLRGFTHIANSVPPEEIIPLLDGYAEAVISAIHDAGGEVLKLIGDGILAIFKTDLSVQACRQALEAEASARQRVDGLNRRRMEQGLPVTDFYLGLHIGEVFYGNIGSADRLDFTVVGPAVNEASRIAAMCRSIERTILLSSAFAAALDPDDRERVVSVGRYALRGIKTPQELFTLEPIDEAG